MKVYVVRRGYYDDEWETWGDNVEGIFLTEDDAIRAVEMLRTVGDGIYSFEQHEVEDFKTFEARMNQERICSLPEEEEKS